MKTPKQPMLNPKAIGCALQTDGKAPSLLTELAYLIEYEVI